MTERADPSRSRHRMLGVICVSLFFALIARLWFLQVIDPTDFQVSAAGFHTRSLHEQGTRGRILDRNGKVLVDNRIIRVVELEHDPINQLSAADRDTMFSKLADVLLSFDYRIKSAFIERRFEDKRFAPSDPVPIAREVTDDLSIYLAEHHDEFTGVAVRQRSVRIYPYGKVAAHLLGYVGQIGEKSLADQEAIQGTPGKPSGANAKPYQTGDEIGQDGAERSFEQDLRAVPGDKTIQVDARGNYLRTIDEVKPRAGDDVWLTIDIDVQAFAEKLLDQKLSELRGRVVTDSTTKKQYVLKAPQGSVVLEDPGTAQVLAMASAPSYDPSTLVDGIDSDTWDFLQDPSNGQPLFNWALKGQYAPGSTFKLVTAHAAVENGFLHQSNDSYTDRGSYTASNCSGAACTKRNSGGSRYGTIALSKAITVSSDVFFYWIGDGLWQGRGAYGDDALQRSAELYGLGERSGIDLPGESTGRIPTPESVKANHEAHPEAFPRGEWTVGDEMNTAVGQGEVLVTPLQLANTYATFANGGTLRTPQILARVTRARDLGVDPANLANFDIIREGQSQTVGTVPFTADHYQQIYDGLYGVVNAGGTAAGVEGLARRVEDGGQDRHRAGLGQGRHLVVRGVRPGRRTGNPGQLRHLRSHPRSRLRYRRGRTAGVQHHARHLLRPGSAGHRRDATATVGRSRSSQHDDDRRSVAADDHHGNHDHDCTADRRSRRWDHGPVHARTPARHRSDHDALNRPGHAVTIGIGAGSDDGSLGGGSAAGGLGSTVRNRDLNAAWRHVDVVLCALIGLTAAFGSLLIYSATRRHPDPTEFISKHLIYVMLGIGAMALCAAVDYERLRSLARLIFLGALGLLGLVLVPGIGSLHKGIRAWFDIGPIQIQPAEPAKLAVIILLASYLGTVERIRARHAVVALVILGLPMGLIMLQPDLGTTLVFVVIGAGMLLVAGVPARFLIALLAICIIAVVGILQSDTLDKYQRDRLTAFATPDSVSGDITYNTKQAQTAIASGGATGKGLFDGPQTKGGFVPEQQTDFIFTVPGEELGFAGSFVLLLLLGGIVWRTWRIAGLASDRVGMLMCVGVLCLFAFHIFENVGMNLGIMPVTGIPLPFVSYGGSSTITAFASMGLVLNVHMRRYR